MMPRKASIVRLDPESQTALANLSSLLGRPMNKLVNEAVRDYLLKESAAERELTSTLASLREFRARSVQRSETSPRLAIPAVADEVGDARGVFAARDFVSRVAVRHAVKAALLFGSRARGTHRADSDVDIALLLRGGSGSGSGSGSGRSLTNTSIAMADIAFDVLLETGIYIQPLPIWEDEWEHPDTHSNPRLLDNIRREGLLL
jgi:uncharacterized protein